MMGETSDESRNDEDDVLARKLEAVVWTFAKWPEQYKRMKRWRARLDDPVDDVERRRDDFYAFFTAAYHNGFGHQFAIGLESANLVQAAFKDAPDIESAKRKLTDLLGEQATEIERHAERVDFETGWRYLGIDLSPAPLKDVSIGAAIEELIQQPFGSAGTLTASGAITAALKAVDVRQTGYNGLMLPILEDSRLAERWAEGRVSLEGLLSYSSVCATGLDTIPLPGDVSIEQLDMILADVATLAVKWKKPLSARLLPVKGKGPGEPTAFDNPFLVNTVIQPFSRAGASRGNTTE